MKAYIGTKIILAEPCTKAQFAMKKDYPFTPGDEAVQGYAARYASGYESWSPKDVFEEAYRPVSGGEKELIH